jgi:hypothetical protein
MGCEAPKAVVHLAGSVYYIDMAQPKEPPLSIRLPALTLAELKAEAARRKVTVNALIVRAVQKELALWSDEDVAEMRARPREPLVINRIEPPMRLPRAPMGSLLKKPAKGK